MKLGLAGDIHDAAFLAALWHVGQSGDRREEWRNTPAYRYVRKGWQDLECQEREQEQETGHAPGI